MRKIEVKKKPVGRLYTVAIVWTLYALNFPLYKLGHFFVAISITLIMYFFASRIFKEKIEYIELPEPEPEPVSYGSEIDAIIAEGEIARTEMTRLRASIQSPEIKARIDELIQISGKIVEDAIHDPSDVPQIKKFLSYYLPTTIKLLNTYDRMSEVGYDGKNISGTMTRIEAMLDTAIAAYKRQLDSLFADQALDIETDIDVMNAMLAREGLADKGIK